MFSHEVIVKVPAPFKNISSLGFTASYHKKETFEIEDIPFVFEGESEKIASLKERLELMASVNERDYFWSYPIPLNNQICLFSLRYKKQEQQKIITSELDRHEYLKNLIYPMFLLFLEDCINIAQIPLSDEIQYTLYTQNAKPLTMHLQRQKIISQNGNIPL